MLIDEIKKANLLAMKEHNADKRAAYSMVISRYQTLLTSGKGGEIKDEDVIAILMKFSKELEEEAEGYRSAGREESYRSTLAQKEAVAAFLPKLLSEEEIKAMHPAPAPKAERAERAPRNFEKRAPRAHEAKEPKGDK